MMLMRKGHFIRLLLTVVLTILFSFCTGEKQTARNIPDLHDQHVIVAPRWAREGVLYQISPGTFTREGTFTSLKNRLDYLQKLGVTILWLTPVFPAAPVQGNDSVTYPYVIENFQNLNPHFGNAQDFRDLVSAIHGLGMKVILGLAIAFTSNSNTLIREHPDWFTKGPKSQLSSPKEENDISWFNYDNPGLRHYMKDILQFWVKEYDIDGYACMITGSVPLDFWKASLKRLREIKLDIYLLAQGEDPQLLLTGFNSIYGQAVYEELISIHSCRSRTAKILNLIMLNQQYLPHNTLTLNYLENDNTPRSMKIFGARAIQAYTSLLFTLPGLPLLVAGQETGETGKPELYAKSIINWQQADTTLLDMYRGLVTLRKSWSCFTSGEYVQLPTASLSGSVGAFLRLGRDSAAIILANLKNRSAQKVLITLPEGLPGNLTQFSWEGYRETNTSFNINYMYFTELLPYNTRIFLGLNKKRGI